MCLVSMHTCGCCVFSVFFFFQAEDGIRDVAVTGVQTCALPILAGRRPRPGRSSRKGSGSMTRSTQVLRNSDPYAALGVRRLINAWGTVTRVGGSLMPPEVLDAMAAAAHAFVDVNELHERAGDHLAGLLGVPAVFVSSGAAAGLALAAAACIAGEDPARMARLPETGGLPRTIAIHRAHRNRYDQCLRLPGAVFAEFGGADRTEPWELEAALTPEVVAVAFVAQFADAGGSLPLETVVRTASQRNIPVIVDAAAELPPVENLWAFIQRGAALAIFSGGEGLRRP